MVTKEERQAHAIEKIAEALHKPPTWEHTHALISIAASLEKLVDFMSGKKAEPKLIVPSAPVQPEVGPPVSSSPAVSTSPKKGKDDAKDS